MRPTTARLALAWIAVLAMPVATAALACGPSESDYPGGGRRLTPPGGEGGIGLSPADAGVQAPGKDSSVSAPDTSTPTLPDASTD